MIPKVGYSLRDNRLNVYKIGKDEEFIYIDGCEFNTEVAYSMEELEKKIFEICCKEFIGLEEIDLLEIKLNSCDILKSDKTSLEAFMKRIRKE